jgi:diguanylate cyclase (GGDEF)-like protein
VQGASMANSNWRVVVGPLVTVATAAGIYVCDRYLFTVPNPGAISFVAVVFAAYIGGVAAGLVSAAISIVYAIVHFSPPGQLGQLTPDNLARLYVLAVATPIIALMVGVLRARAKRALAREHAARTGIEAVNDELLALRSALDRVDYGIVLLDREMRAQFINRAFREMWRLPDELADRKPAFVGLMYHGRDTKAYAVRDSEMDAYVAQRIALIRAGDERPVDIRLANGEAVCLRCKVLPEGGRMLTYANVTARVHHAEDLEDLATHDPLTGLYNRRQFIALAEGEWERFLRYQRPLSLLVLDIDHFKAVNDRYGHEAGDRAIGHVADVCHAAKRASDVAARIGGEEFALLLPETSLADACTLAERIREAIFRRTFLADGGHPLSVTISIGTSEARLDQDGIPDLLRQADAALYEAKRAGRNRVAVFDPSRPIAQLVKPATAA